MAKTSAAKKRQNGGANLGLAQTLWAVADKLRGHMDAAEYKHVVLGLIFLNYISDAFEEQHANPPFYMSDWGGDRLRHDPRWKCGAPPVDNANLTGNITKRG
jgi:type I restriction-modification system DNA methylase subunit